MSEDIVWVQDYLKSSKYRTELNFDGGERLEEIVSIIEEVNELVVKQNWKNVRLERDESVDPQYAKLFFAGLRPETEKEKAFRLKELESAKNRKQKQKKDKEERDKKEYERLKKKFGD